MYQRTLTEVEQAVESITLKLGAKGEYGWEIKVAFMNGGESEALVRLASIDTELREQYGRAE